MKQFLVAALTILFMTTGYYHLSVNNKSDFENWALKNNKYYTDKEKLFRMEIYNSNKKMIEQHNQREDVSYKMGENQFMSLTNEEFLELYLQKQDDLKDIIQQEIQEIKYQRLTAVDWRNYTTVKNQGECNSGWAFSVSNSLESWYAIKGFQKINASTQQIVDCDQQSWGCAGGHNQYALDYVQRVGLMSSSNYPYVAKNQTCKQTRNGTFFINGYTYIGGSQWSVYQYLSDYPVSVGIDATNWNCSSNPNATNHNSQKILFLQSTKII
ncbi:unnamed protein product [Paramecium sonneborni]|uniref:Uncharacterized protein n=1 Tax=Paramecium sonneborni TaxID=65129 RepID=A0A8S1NA40_9CILI|nr:unnamed protein product [Paramecium sonneborni]